MTVNSWHVDFHANLTQRNADENLDCQEVVHVFLRRSNPSRCALHQAGQARQCFLHDISTGPCSREEKALIPFEVRCYLTRNKRIARKSNHSGCPLHRMAVQPGPIPHKLSGRLRANLGSSLAAATNPRYCLENTPSWRIVVSRIRQLRMLFARHYLADLLPSVIFGPSCRLWIWLDCAIFWNL